jgi:hypothetical protein
VFAPSSHGWSRDALIENGVRLTQLGFGIVRVYHPLDASTCSCKQRGACLSIGKHPVGDKWQERAEYDTDRVRTMLGNPGNESYGIVPPPEVFVWDVDKDAPLRLKSLEAELGPLPRTRVHRSGNGKHIFYRWPANLERPGNLFGLTTRWAPGGMVVGPGSVHAPTGHLYAVEDDSPISELPEPWARAATAFRDELSTAQDSALPGDPDWIIPENHRHDFLVRSAARFRSIGLRGDGLLAAIRALNSDRCANGGKADSELVAIAEYFEAKASVPPARFMVIDPPRNPEGIDAADLLALDLPPLTWAVPDLLPEGTTILASPPKVGKSCLVYGIATEVALGGEFLGRRVASGSALYLALEDGQRRGRERLLAALGGRTMPRGRLEVRWSATRIGEGLEDDLARWLDGHADARLVAIDTLGKVRPRRSGSRNAYEVDVEDLGRLQTMFRNRSVALLVVHHSRKATSDDFLASVSGTYGITGSADTVVVIRRKRLEDFGTIVITGRDVPEAEISVRFDGQAWHLAPTSPGSGSFERAEVFRVIEAEGPIFPKAIADRLALERTSVQHMVDKLIAEGAVARTTRGYVSSRTILSVVPDHSEHSPSDLSDREDPSPRGRRQSRPACFATELAYVAHQSQHYQFESGWGCRLCEAYPRSM